MRCFPNLRALANSIGAHYVHGMAVHRGQRGARGRGRPHEDDHRRARDHTLLPKTRFAMAMQRGARAKVDGKFVVDPQFESAVTNARWEALYPQALVDEMPGRRAACS